MSSVWRSAAMSEDVYAKPDLTQKVRYGRGEKEGEREDGIATIYVTVNHPDPRPDANRNPAQNNTAQQQHGGKDKYN